MKTKAVRGGTVTMFVCFSLLALTLSTLSACTPFTTASVAPTKATRVWGLPFKTGTPVTLGALGLHDDNFGSMPGVGFTYHFSGAGTIQDASLDLLPVGASVPVIPLAPGKVLATWPTCHLVVVDHGNGVWVEYLHIVVAVTPGQQVTRDTILGRTTTNVSTGEPCREVSEGPNGPVEHVHFAFLQGAGEAGAFQSMVGRTLCGYLVKQDANGTLMNVNDTPQTITPGQSFTVPTCPTGGTSVTPTPKLPTGTIKEFPTPTPQSYPNSLVSGPDGNLWFTEGMIGGNASAIGRVTPSGVITELPTTTTLI